MEIILLVALIIFVVMVFRKWKNKKPITNNSIICFTGGLGSGKTYLGVQNTIRFYKRSVFRWKMKRLLPWTKKQPKPQLLSNIPLRYRRSFFGKRVYSDVLRVEHLLMQKKIPPNSVIFIDEVGQFLDQYSYDNKFVMVDIQEFVRFFRHYVGRKHGRLFMTDQSISNVTLQIKRRVNVIYNLNNFHRYMGFLPFGICEVHELEMVEETVNQTDGITTNKDYFFFRLPYRISKKKRVYDTYCYSKLYMTEDEKKMPEKWTSLKAEGFIELPFEKYKRK